MKCPKCGGEAGEKDSFCEKCGTALVKEKISYKKLLAVAFVVGVFLLGFWLIAPIFSDKKTFTNSIGMEFVLIPVGEFDMGSNEYYREKPVHPVRISKSFYLGKYEVTQKQWRAIMGNNPSTFTGDELPVENVTWNEVQGFINNLNYKEGSTRYRLPSEAEWEYAARAGTISRYSFGDDESKLGEYAWYSNNSGDRSTTHPVGQKKPNTWGLYDMSGNVWEWVQDKYHDSYDGAPEDGSAWESGNGSVRVGRGSSFNYLAWDGRSAARRDVDMSNRFGLGFRLVRNL